MKGFNGAVAGLIHINVTAHAQANSDVMRVSMMPNKPILAFAAVVLLIGPTSAQEHRQRAGTPPPHGASGFRGGPALPRPNNFYRFQPLDGNRWQRGRWYHGFHDGRQGWWWTVGPNWFFYNSPVYPFPGIYGPPGAAPGWWYWCDASQEYYPYVTYCLSGWRRLPPS